MLLLVILPLVGGAEEIWKYLSVTGRKIASKNFCVGYSILKVSR
jgi:hypothetical protein